MRLHIGVFVIVLAACGCAAGRATRPERGHSDPDGGLIFVYADPTLPAAAGEEPPRIEQVIAAREDGVEVELRLAYRPRKRDPRTVLVAWGRVPPGRYARLRLALDARQRGARGRAVSSEEATAALDLELRRGRGAVVRLGADAAGGWIATVAHPRPPGVLGAVPVRGADALLLFDRLAGEVVGVVPTGRGPVDVAIDARRSRAYVALAGEDAVEIVELLDPVSLGRIPLVPGDEPSSILLAADSGLALTANRGSGTVSLVDVDGRTERSRVSVGERPVSLASDPLRRRVFVAQEVPAAVTIVDLSRGAVAGVYPVEARPVRIRFDAASRRLWVAHAAVPSVAALDPESGTTLRRLELGSPATALALDPRAGTVLLATAEGLTIDAFGSTSSLPERGYPAGGAVRFLEVDSDANGLWVVHDGRDEIRLLGLVGGQEIARIDTGPDPGEPSFFTSR